MKKVIHIIALKGVMKRLLQLVVVMVMVLGLWIPANASPNLLGYYDTNIQAWDIALSSDGTTVYVAGWGGYDSFQVIDVTNPTSPSLLGGLTTTYSSNYLTLSHDNTKAYVSNHAGGFLIVDISNPTVPSIFGTYNNGNPRTRDFAISSDGTTAYVTDGIVGLQIINISNPSSPTLLGVL